MEDRVEQAIESLLRTVTDDDIIRVGLSLPDPSPNEEYLGLCPLKCRRMYVCIENIQKLRSDLEEAGFRIFDDVLFREAIPALKHTMDCILTKTFKESVEIRTTWLVVRKISKTLH